MKRRGIPWCVKCKVIMPAMFMVTDELWAEAGFNKDDIACFPCLRIQLDGKRLLLRNFPDFPINQAIRAVIEMMESND